MYGYRKKLQDYLYLSSLSEPPCCSSKNIRTRDFKGNSFLRSAQWEAERDKKQTSD
jgi:hypothetical protein